MHRDIKPSNLLLDDRGNVWVADFGLAKSEAMDNLTQSGDILGTVRYMPPEAFEGVSGTAGDVYSLGITLYELTTLRSAYESEDKRQLIKLVASEPPTPIHRSREGVPADLATIVHKAIEREPAHRYRSAGDLAEDLRRFLSDEPILARRIPYLERLRRWSRRNKQLAASMIGIACLLVLIAIGSAGSSIYFRQQEEKSNILAAGNQRLLEENRVALRKAVDLAARLEKARQAAVEQEETTQRNLYYSHMSNANQAIGGHRGLGRTLALLNQWRPKKGMADLRGWEWYYINGRCYQEEFSLAAHQDDIRGVCRSPDDRFVASVGLDGTLVIWDVESRKLVRQIRDEFQEGYCVAWNAAGNRLAVGSNAGLIVWDSSTWEVARRIHETRKVLGVTWGPNGRLLAAAMEKTPDAPALITLIETEGWETYASMTTRTLGLYNVSVSFNSDGDLFAYADFKNAVIWDVQEKRELRRLIGHTGTIQATQFHPQRNEILASGSRDAKILIWNALTGARQGTLNGHTHAVSAVNWHPDGKRLASASWDGTIRIWDVEAAQTRHAYSSHSAHVFSLAWNQRGEQLVSGGDDRLVKSWHAEGAGSEARIVTSADVFVRLSFSPDGCKLAGAAAGGRVYMLDAESMQVLWQEQHGRSTVRRVLFASDTRSFLSVSVDSTVRRWSMEPELISAVKVGVNNVRTADMHPDGEKLAVGGGDGKIEIWNADLSERRQTIETTFPLVNYLRWSPDGQSLAIVGNKREIRLFDMASNHFRIIPVNASEVWTVEWNSSGDKIITTSSDQRIQVWDVDSMSRLMHFDGHFDYIPAVSWCCNGRRILSADARGTVKIWDTELNREQGQELLSLSTPVGELRAACWSPDGKKIAAASRGVITIWDATRGYEIEEKQFGTNASHVQEDDSAP